MKQDVDPVPTALCVCVFFFNLFTWLHQVLVAALGSAIFLEACRLFSYHMQTLSCGMQDLDP